LKNKKALYLLLTANAISQFAQGISMLAIPWYFTKQINQASTFASIYSVATFLTLFWGLYAGTLIDRYPRKKIFLSICVISAIVLIGVSGYGFANGSIPILMIGFIFCFTLFNYNIHYPTLYAFGQEITEKKNYSKTNSLLEVIGQTTNVISGAVAVLLIEGVEFSSLNIRIESWDLHQIFLLDGITYILAMAIISQIKYRPIEQVRKSMGSIKVRLKEGLAFLNKNRLLFHFGNSSFTVFIFVLISMHLLWPIYIENHLEGSGEVYATTKIHYALGALLSGFFISMIFRRSNPILSIIFLSALSLIAYVTMASNKSSWVLFACALVLGITNAGIRIQRITYLFNHIPNYIIGRTNSVFQSINISLRSVLIAVFSIPFFIEDSNILITFWVAALIILISIVPLVWNYKALKALKKEK